MVGSTPLTGYVALTFDDGPSPESTPALLRALADAKARASFFVCGEPAARYPRLLNEIVAAGMWLGNHSYSHPYLTGLADRLVHNEIAHTQRTIERISGQSPALFRPPFGDTNDLVRAHTARLGLTETLWTVDGRDWAGASTDDIVRSAAGLQPGGILLLHDGYASTVAALPRILRELDRRGLRTGRIATGPADEHAAHPRIVAP